MSNSNIESGINKSSIFDNDGSYLELKMDIFGKYDSDLCEKVMHNVFISESKPVSTFKLIWFYKDFYKKNEIKKCLKNNLLIKDIGKNISKDVMNYIVLDYLEEEIN